MTFQTSDARRSSQDGVDETIKVLASKAVAMCQAAHTPSLLIAFAAAEEALHFCMDVRRHGSVSALTRDRSALLDQPFEWFLPEITSKRGC